MTDNRHEVPESLQTANFMPLDDPEGTFDADANAFGIIELREDFQELFTYIRTELKRVRRVVRKDRRLERVKIVVCYSINTEALEADDMDRLFRPHFDTVRLAPIPGTPYSVDQRGRLISATSRNDGSQGVFELINVPTKDELEAILSGLQSL